MYTRGSSFSKGVYSLATGGMCALQISSDQALTLVQSPIRSGGYDIDVKNNWEILQGMFELHFHLCM